MKLVQLREVLHTHLKSLVHVAALQLVPPQLLKHARYFNQEQNGLASYLPQTINYIICIIHYFIRKEINV